jgi:hypothetical protein
MNEPAAVLCGLLRGGLLASVPICRFHRSGADLPMSALSLYYLVRSVDECIHSADAHRTPSSELVVCGLTEGPANLVNVLSAVTSAAMLM